MITQVPTTESESNQADEPKKDRGEHVEKGESQEANDAAVAECPEEAVNAPDATPKVPLRKRVTPIVFASIALLALALSVNNRMSLRHDLEQLNQRCGDLAQQCAFNQRRGEVASGSLGDEERRLWNHPFFPIDHAMPFMSQVHTQFGAVNVVRTKPKSNADQHTLEFKLTNPNLVPLGRGRFTVRWSDESKTPPSTHDYEAFVAWTQSLQSNVTEIEKLGPGETFDVQVVLPQIGIEPLKYVDFQLTFDYFTQPEA